MRIMTIATGVISCLRNLGMKLCEIHTKSLFFQTPSEAMVSKTSSGLNTGFNTKLFYGVDYKKPSIWRYEIYPELKKHVEEKLSNYPVVSQ